MHLPSELRDEHCKHLLQRFEKLVDGFRKTASLTAIGALAFFVLFFVPYIKLGYDNAKLVREYEADRSNLDNRRQEFATRIKNLEARQAKLRHDEEMLARIDACKQAAEEVEQLRREIEVDFTFPLEVPALDALPAKLTSAIPVQAAPWSVDWSGKRHLDRVAHYRVMLAILSRISIHQEFLEDRIFAPVLGELDAAGRVRTWQQAEEIRAALRRLHQHVQSKFEAPLKDPNAGSTGDPGTPRNFGLWESYAFDPSQPDRQFTAVLTDSFRQSLHDKAASVTREIEQLVQNAPWNAALRDAWSELGLEKEVRREMTSIGISDDDLNGLLKVMNLDAGKDVVADPLKLIEPSAQQLQDALKSSGVDLSDLASKFLRAFPSDKAAKPNPDEAADPKPTDAAEPEADELVARVTASVTNGVKRQIAKKLPGDLEKEKAAIAATERDLADRVQQVEDRLNSNKEMLRQRLERAGEFFGKMPVSLEDAILLFPVLLAGGFLICCAQFSEAARLRGIYGELACDESAAPGTVDLAGLLPFPLADRDKRLLRWGALIVPFLFQFAALLLLFTSNTSGDVSQPTDASGHEPAGAATAAPDAPLTSPVAADDAPASVDDSADDEADSVSERIAGEPPDSSTAALPPQDANWIYLLAFLVSIFGMTWGAFYAASTLPKPSNEQRLGLGTTNATGESAGSASSD